MDAGEIMVEFVRPSNITTSSGETHEGIKQYYVQKIEELQVRMMEEKVMILFFFLL